MERGRPGQPGVTPAAVARCAPWPAREPGAPASPRGLGPWTRSISSRRSGRDGPGPTGVAGPRPGRAHLDVTMDLWQEASPGIPATCSRRATGPRGLALTPTPSRSSLDHPVSTRSRGEVGAASSEVDGAITARCPVPHAVAFAISVAGARSCRAHGPAVWRARRRPAGRSARAAAVALPCGSTRQSRGTSYAKTSEHEALPRVRGRRPGRAVRRYRVEGSGRDHVGPRRCRRAAGCLGGPRLLGVVGGGGLALRVLAVRRRRRGPGSRTWRDQAVRCWASFPAGCVERSHEHRRTERMSLLIHSQ